jgi:hypothetical protein
MQPPPIPPQVALNEQFPFSGEGRNEVGPCGGRQPAPNPDHVAENEQLFNGLGRPRFGSMSMMLPIPGTPPAPPDPPPSPGSALAPGSPESSPVSAESPGNGSGSWESPGSGSGNPGSWADAVDERPAVIRPPATSTAVTLRMSPPLERGLYGRPPCSSPETGRIHDEARQRVTCRSIGERNPAGAGAAGRPAALQLRASFGYVPPSAPVNPAPRLSLPSRESSPHENTPARAPRWR